MEQNYRWACRKVTPVDQGNGPEKKQEYLDELQVVLNG
jgi:hypothetical protein